MSRSTLFILLIITGAFLLLMKATYQKTSHFGHVNQRILKQEMEAYRTQAQFARSSGNEIPKYEPPKRGLMQWVKSKVRQVKNEGLVSALTREPQPIPTVENVTDPAQVHGEGEAKKPGEEGVAESGEKKEENKCKDENDESEECLEQRERELAEEEEKEDKAEEVAQSQEPSNVDSNTAKKSPTQSQQVVFYPNVPAKNPTAQQQEEEKRPESTFEYWAALLLKSPNKKETQRMIESYQDGTLKSQDFYLVVKALLAEDDVKFKELGVFALSQVPNERSYTLLVDVQKAETPGSSFYQTVSSAMQAYTDVRYLSMHARLLQNNENIVMQIESATMIQESAEKYLAESNGVPPTAQVVAAFNRILPTLNNVAQTAEDASVKELVQTVASRVETLLGGDAGTNPAPPSDGQQTTRPVVISGL